MIISKQQAKRLEKQNILTIMISLSENLTAQLFQK